MARVLDVIGGSAGGNGAVFQISGGLFLLCMVVVSLSIISMVVFACSDSGKNGKHGGRHRRRHDGGGEGCGGEGCCGCGGGGDGGDGGGCGGGGCGGGGGGGGGGCGGGGGGGC